MYQSLLLRQNVDVSGQTQILWRGKTTRRNNLNEKQRSRGVDEVKNNNKRTGSSLGKLFNNVYIQFVCNNPTFQVDGISTRPTDLT